MVRRGELLAVPMGGAERIPACQFEDAEVLPGLDKVLQAMPVANAWTKLGDLLEPLEGHPGSPSLLDLLERREASYAAELAARLHETGGL